MLQPEVISLAMLKRSISRKMSNLSASQVVSQPFYDSIRTTKIGVTVHHKLYNGNLNMEFVFYISPPIWTCLFGEECTDTMKSRKGLVTCIKCLYWCEYSMLLNWQRHIGIPWNKSEKMKLPPVMSIRLVNLTLPNNFFFK